MKTAGAILVIGVLASAAGITIAAEAPAMMNYQGRLVENGQLINSNGLAMQLTLYDSPSGSNVVYQETDTVTVVDGLYTTTIGDNQSFGSAASLLDALNTLGTNAWLGIKFGSDQELTPRERLMAAPFALRLRGVCVKDDGKVGIGTEDPQVALHVVYPSAQAVILIAPTNEVDGGDSQVTFAEDRYGTNGMALFYKGATNQLQVYGKQPGWVGPHVVINRGDGKVGIGTNAPAEKLHVAGNIRANTFYGDGSGLTNVPGGADLWTSGAGGTISYSSGNVGIGTTNPTEALHIFKSSGVARAKVESDSGDVTLRLDSSTGTSQLKFEDDGIEQASIGLLGGQYLAFNHNGQVTLKNGDLGIGDATPSHKLDVAGDIGVDHKLQARGTAGLALATRDGTERLQIDDAGRISIGSAPSANDQLLIYGASTNARMQLKSDTGSSRLVLDGAIGNNEVTFENNDVYRCAVGYDSAGAHMYLYNGGNVVLKGGNLGVGTLTPTNKLHVNGGITASGPCYGTFPRPNYDSGWIPLAVATSTSLVHNVGGNTDNYVVDLQFKDTGDGFGINQVFYGGDDWDGASWRALTTTSIDVQRVGGDKVADEIRVRIWVYE